MSSDADMTLAERESLDLRSGGDASASTPMHPDTAGASAPGGGVRVDRYVLLGLWVLRPRGEREVPRPGSAVRRAGRDAGCRSG